MSFLTTISFDPYCAPTGPSHPQYNRLLVGTHFFSTPPEHGVSLFRGVNQSRGHPRSLQVGQTTDIEMREKLAAAREELETDSVVKLMAATGASRSNVRTWIRSSAAPVKLGRPSVFSEKEEDVIAYDMAAWTKGCDILTREYASVLLRQYIGDVGRVEEAELRFGRGGMPGRSYFELFLRHHPQLCRVRSVGIESVRAHASTPEAVAKFCAAYRFLCRDLSISRAAQVWNTDESMMNGQKLMQTTPVTVLEDAQTTDPDFVFPSVQSGAEAASLVAPV